MKQVCKDRYEAFGTAGNAAKIKPLSLAQMTDLYSAGKLDPIIK
jgi:fructose-bisphosphate aldolase class II